MNSVKHELIMAELDLCIKAIEEAHESMFTQCLSNTIYNHRGVAVDVTKINDMLQVAMHSKAVLQSHRGAPANLKAPE